MKLLSRFLFFHKNGPGRHAGVKGSGASRPDQKVDLLGQLLSQNRVFSIFRKEPPSPLEEVANLAKHINLFFSLSVIYQGILVTSSTTRIFYCYKLYYNDSWVYFATMLLFRFERSAIF